MAYMNQYGNTTKSSPPRGHNKKSKKVIARAPTPKQRQSGKLSPSNVKWVLGACTCVADVDAALASVDDVPFRGCVRRALKKHFKDAQGYVEALQSHTSPTGLQSHTSPTGLQSHTSSTGLQSHTSSTG
jgi:hypothetical protein